MISTSPCSFVSDPEQLAHILGIPQESLAAVHHTYPLRISSYYLELIKQYGAPLWRQMIPDIKELEDTSGFVDPLNEENLSPVPGLVHKYPGQALFLVSDQCACYCRFCTRKRKVGKAEMSINKETIDAGINYLKKNPSIYDVLLSGGDPFMLTDQCLENLLASLRRIPSIAIIRIGTRIPCTFPFRVTKRFAAMLKKYHPLYINTHFNHPAEVTPEAALACQYLADAGIPLACQTVLLRGINDSPELLKQLFLRLLKIRVRPYYLFQMDLTRGTSHFRTDIDTGQSIMHTLIGDIPGMALPTYALDAPGGGGKIPLTPNFIEKRDNHIEFTPPLGKTCSYPTCFKS